jgi:hypothetical protein
MEIYEIWYRGCAGSRYTEVMLTEFQQSEIGTRGPLEFVMCNIDFAFTHIFCSRTFLTKAIHI